MSVDEYIQKKADRFAKGFSDIFNQFYPEASEHVLTKGFNECRKGSNIIVDSPNLLVKDRKVWIDSFKEFDYSLVCVFVNTPLESLLIRHKNWNRLKHGKRLTEDGIRYMFESVEPPKTSEGFDKVIVA